MFLRSYYSIYDFENKRVGLALHKFSNASIEHDSKAWVYIVIVVSLAIIAVSGVVYWFINKRQAKKESEELEEQRRLEDQNFGDALMGGL